MTLCELSDTTNDNHKQSSVKIMPLGQEENPTQRERLIDAIDRGCHCRHCGDNERWWCEQWWPGLGLVACECERDEIYMLVRRIWDYVDENFSIFLLTNLPIENLLIINILNYQRMLLTDFKIVIIVGFYRWKNLSINELPLINPFGNSNLSTFIFVGKVSSIIDNVKFYHCLKYNFLKKSTLL